MKPEEAAQRLLTAGLAASILLFVVGLTGYLAVGCADLLGKILLIATMVLIATPFLMLTAVIVTHIARREFCNAIITMFVFLLMLLSLVLGLKH
mgnify:CR=1 FL=1